MQEKYKIFEPRNIGKGSYGDLTIDDLIEVSYSTTSSGDLSKYVKTDDLIADYYDKTTVDSKDQGVKNWVISQNYLVSGDLDNYVTTSTLNSVLTEYMQTSHPANDITTTNINNWNTAYGWGNHANAGYATTSSVTAAIDGIRNYAISVRQTTNVIQIAYEKRITSMTLTDMMNVSGFSDFILYKGNVAGTTRSTLALLQADITAMTSAEVAAGYTIEFKINLTAGASSATALLKSIVS